MLIVTEEVQNHGKIVFTKLQGWRSRDKSRSREWVKNSDLGLEATGSRSRSRYCVSRLLLLVSHFSCLHHVSEWSRFHVDYRIKANLTLVIFYPMLTRENDFNKTFARITYTYLIPTILLISWLVVQNLKIARSRGFIFPKAFRLTLVKGIVRIKNV